MADSFAPVGVTTINTNLFRAKEAVVDPVDLSFLSEENPISVDTEGSSLVSDEDPQKPSTFGGDDRKAELKQQEARFREQLEGGGFRQDASDPDAGKKSGRRAFEVGSIDFGKLGIPGAPPEGMDPGKMNLDIALNQAKAPDPSHPHAQKKQALKGKLDKLGLLKTNGNRIHINDSDPAHGGAVARVAVGPTSMAEGADATLKHETSEATRKAVRSPEQQQRSDEIDTRHKKIKTGDVTSDGLADHAVARMENTVLEKAEVLHETRKGVPKDGKKTFVDMSWGASAQDESNGMTGHMLKAPKGSKLHQEASKALTDKFGQVKKADGTFVDREPLGIGKDGAYLNSQEEFEHLRDQVVAPKIEARMATPEYKSRMTTARQTLESEAKLGKEAGVLGFTAAGNDHAGAAAKGRPELSKTASNGTEGLVDVGYVDPGGPGRADDKMASGSAEGAIDVAFDGVGIPAGIKGSGVMGGSAEVEDVDGSSFATPMAVETAYTMAANDENLSLDGIVDLMKDPRVAVDLEGTNRDGAGHVDHDGQFAAVVLAASSKRGTLTSEQIQNASQRLEGDLSPSDLATLKADLGLS